MRGVDFRLEWDPDQPERFFRTDDEFFANWDARMQTKVMRAAKRRAPRKSGELRRSVRGFTDRDTEGVYSDVGTDLPHGKYQETGHKAPDGTRVAARRYLRPALRSLRRGR